MFLLLDDTAGPGLTAAAVLSDQAWNGSLFDAADEDAILFQSCPPAPPAIARIATVSGSRAPPLS